MSVPAAPVSATRLRFIDMARAVAILLMLEGHFVGVTLADEWRVVGHPLYDAWSYCRGVAAPMFFTTTGLIFAYLLSGAREPGFLRVRRVRLGLLRAAELVFWGYLLQVNPRLLPGVFRGEWDSWLQAFHVLQCIGAGLLGMIGLFGLFRRAGPRTLAGAYAVAGLLVSLAGVFLANQPGPIPEDAPVWLQNAIKGPRSSFPLAPWLGFTFYGAAVGVLVRYQSAKSPGGVGIAGFLIVGLVFRVFGWSFDRFVGSLLLDLSGHSGPRVLPDVFHLRVGEILIVLGILRWLEMRFRPGASWFQTIGRNTFPIYVVHVVVLYGGIFGLGLERWFGRALNPWQAAIGAVLFCGVFGLFAQGVEPLMLRWKTWRATVSGRGGGAAGAPD